MTKNQFRSCTCAGLQLCLSGLGTSSLNELACSFLVRNTTKETVQEDHCFKPVFLHGYKLHYRTGNSQKPLLLMLLCSGGTGMGNPKFFIIHLLQCSHIQQIFTWHQQQKACSFTGCKATTAAAWALKKLELLRRKKSQTCFLQWKLKGKKKMVQVSLLLPNLRMLFQGSWWCLQRMIQQQHVNLLHSQ